MRRLLLPVLLVLVAALTAVPTAAPAQAARAAQAAQADPTFTTRVFSLVPGPGRAAYVHVARNGRVYAGTYADEGSRRSRVHEWTADGTLLRSWTVPGQRLGVEHGVQVANETRDGRLVLLETSIPAVLTLDVRTGRFERVARFPAGASPNYATWGPRHLFVTDYAAGVVYRVRRNGRVEPWFRSAGLEGIAGFGTTGIVYDRRRGAFLLTQQTTARTTTQGLLYSLPVRRGRPGRLTPLWTSRPTDLPDGFGVGRSGRLYVANAGLTAQLVVLSPTGQELRRFPDVPLTGDNGSPVPFDTPSNATFLGTRVLVANQSAIAGNDAHQAILSVEVGERGRPPHLPRSARFVLRR
ncbi:SMP-30/gluconolactonase/LRE family protein [Nocardioides litoris]|uniref:SMP-30/gluconolactonase/LRE family protein n=1 Tax=Nocardioides litoris TaxID=1926648 RepID=UPI001123C3C9|nr:hypothetical protein [Nocardioides litoris]